MGNSCGCYGSGTVNSWFDWTDTSPQNPFDLLAYASLSGTTGLYTRASLPSSSWGTSPLVLNSDPVCTALESDNQQMVADAEQWNFQHQTRNTASTLAPPLDKVIFLRGGLQWSMEFQIDFGPANASNVMLTFRDNYGTRGDAQGTIPVILWAGPFINTNNLKVTLKSYGRVTMGIVATIVPNNSMYESEWIIVP